MNGSPRQPDNRRRIRLWVGLPLLAVLALTLAATSATAEPRGGGSSAVSAILQQLPGQELHLDRDRDRQRPPDGRTIDAIEVAGNQRIDDETVRFYMSLRPGGEFTWSRAQQDFRTLLNTGFFENLRMHWREGEGGGIVLVVEVEERPRLRQVLIEGTDKVDSEEFLERMEKLELAVEVDSYLDRQLLRRGRQVLMTMLQGDEGLQFVQIDLRYRDSAKGAGVDAVYHVVEGDEARIAQVDFTGNTVFSDRELRWRMQLTGENWLGSFIAKNDRFTWAGFENDMNQVGNAYRAKGYLDYQFEDPEIQAFDVDRFWFLGPKQRLYVQVPIYEGPQYRLGDISVEGNEHFTSDRLLRFVPLEKGEIADVELIVAAKDAMQAAYANEGYFQIFIAPVPVKDEENRVADLVYRVNENALFRIRRIEFEGNTHTRDYVLRRNLRIHENDIWDQELFQKSMFKIQQLGYFRDLEPEITPVEPSGAGGGGTGGDGRSAAPSAQTTDDGTPIRQIDVKLKMREVGRNQISFGGGVSALDGGFVQFGYTTRNLFGRGQTLGFSGQFGGRRQNGQVSFNEPYLLGYKLRFGADFFRNSLDFFGFQQSSTGFSTRVGRPLDREEFLIAYAEYNYQVTDIGDISDTFGGLDSIFFNRLFFQEGKRTSSSLRPFLFWNSIDNPYNPARGTRATLSFEYAGGPLGGTLDFWKATASFQKYVPTVTEGVGRLSKVNQIFAFNVEARWGAAHGDLEELPIFERFFLGGNQSIRGTRLRAVGPRDAAGNILGGTKALQYNLEYIFQLADPLRIAIFHDAGQAWAPDDAPSFGSLRKTYGVEFRVFAPMFNVPFRFFWAYNPEPVRALGEDDSTFEFAIGSTF